MNPVGAAPRLARRQLDRWEMAFQSGIVARESRPAHPCAVVILLRRHGQAETLVGRIDHADPGTPLARHLLNFGEILVKRPLQRRRVGHAGQIQAGGGFAGGDAPEVEIVVDPRRDIQGLLVNAAHMLDGDEVRAAFKREGAFLHHSRQRAG